MELCEGNIRTLFLDQPWDVVEFNVRLDAIKQVAQGCNHIHSLDFVHFDIKSDNVLYRYNESGKIIFKVSDFGVNELICDHINLITLSSILA